MVSQVVSEVGALGNWGFCCLGWKGEAAWYKGIKMFR